MASLYFCIYFLAVVIDTNEEKGRLKVVNQQKTESLTIIYNTSAGPFKQRLVSSREVFPKDYLDFAQSRTYKFFSFSSYVSLSIPF